MATYDSPRPSSQPVGSTDPAVVKDDLITLDKIAVSTEPTVTNRKGGVRKTLLGLEVAAQDAFRLGAGDPQGNYVGGVSVYEESNWTYTYNGQQWGLSGDFDLSTLPYLTTQADPNNDANLAVRGNASQEYVQTEITRGQGENIGGKIFPTDDDVLADGMTVPAGTTHLRVLVAGKPTIVAMSPIASGDVSLLTESGVTVGGVSVIYTETYTPTFRTLSDAINHPTLYDGMSLKLKERTEGKGGGALWDVVQTSTVTPDGFGIVQSTTVPTLSFVIRKSSIMSAAAYGASLDWNGVSGTDDTTVLQYLHNKGITYSLDGKFARISGSLNFFNRMRVYAFGGGIYKENTGYIFTSNSQSIEDFIVYGGFFTGNLLASFADCTGAGLGFNNSARLIKFIDCLTAGIDVAFNWDNARVCHVQRGRYACKTAIIYTGKSAECTIDAAIFVKDAGFPLAGTTGLKSIADGADYPEGLSVHKTLFYRFEYNLDIDDLFIADFTGCYIDSGGAGVQRNRVKYNEKTEGIKFTGCWWYGRGVEWGDAANTAPRQFRSQMIGNHFNAMEPGIDVLFSRFAHSITIDSPQHNSLQIGGHIGYVGTNQNNGIILNNLNFEGYDSYVQFKESGAHNIVSNIPNRDELSSPVYYEYPVNTYNVEGYSIYTDTTVTGGTFAPGDTIVEVDNVRLSSGIAWINLELTDLSIPSSGFLRIAAYTAGTTTPDPNVTIQPNLALITYAASDTSIRVNIPIKVNKATDSKIVIDNLLDSSPTISGGQFANSLTVAQ